MTKRMKGRNARQPSPRYTRAYLPLGNFPENFRVQQPTELDPRNTRIGPLMYGDQTKRDKATGPGIPDEDQGLRGSQDFVGFRTSWDSGLRGNWDFVGFKTSQDSGLRGT